MNNRSQEISDALYQTGTHLADNIATRAEAQLLAGAKVIEDLLGLRGITPIDPRAAARAA